jgi:hypothetical protein
MPEFESMFEQSKAQPIEYKGNTLVMSDFFPTEGASKFRLVIETCNGNPVRQDSASAWSPDRGREHRTADGRFFRTSVDGLALWRNLEPPGRWRQAVSMVLVFKDRKSKWRKGAAKGNDGQFVVEGKVAGGQNGVLFWQSQNYDTVEFEVIGSVSMIEVHNAWDCGNGVVESLHNGAAMIVEEIPNGRRYRCNDGFADDDFDDIVFRLERVG